MRVPGESAAPPDVGAPAGLRLTGNTLSWPDDGWHQVLRLPGYEAVCEGGSSCDVGPGTYDVINLTSGER